jgi:hypothetical protein
MFIYLMVALLAHSVTGYDVPHHVFDDLSLGGCSKAVTGYSSLLLAYIWNKYNDKLMPVNWRPCYFKCRAGRRYSITVIHFFLFYVFIHLYPTVAQMPTMLRVTGMTRGIGRSTWENRVLPIGKLLAASLAEVDPAVRLDPMNHHPWFPVAFTSILDTLPLYVSTPSSWIMNKLLYQPKYGACVLKLQIAITFTKQIIFYTGPHLGELAPRRLSRGHFLVFFVFNI